MDGTRRALGFGAEPRRKESWVGGEGMRTPLVVEGTGPLDAAGSSDNPGGGTA